MPVTSVYAAVTGQYSIDAANNAPMRDLAKALGFETRHDPDDNRQVIHCLYLKKTPLGVICRGAFQHSGL